MDTLLSLLSLVVLLSSECIACLDFESSPCYTDNPSQMSRLFGTKTTYDIARQHFADKSLNVDEAKCKPVMFYLVGRHAIRYPDAEDIAEMAQLLPTIQRTVLDAAAAGRSKLCKKDVDGIANWKMKMVESDDNRISESGRVEIKQIARRFRRMFPSLLNLEKTEFEVGITTKERTRQTADAFLEEIRETTSQEQESDDNDDSDSDESFKETKDKEPNVQVQPFLFFHDTCEELLAYQGVTLGKPKPVKDFKNSQVMKNVLKSVSNRLGLNETLDQKSFKHVVRACHFEFAIFGDSPWCAALGPEELRVLEFYDDLEDFYEDAYGRNINIKSPCTLISDIFKNVKLSVENRNDRRTYLHFTHAGVMKRLYSSFGLFNDLHGSSGSSPATAEEAVCQSSDRRWRSSLITPFSANFVVVLYKCKDGDKDKHRQFKLLTLLQESPVTIKGCDSEFCSLKNFLQTYNSTVTDCNLNEICRI